MMISAFDDYQSLNDRAAEWMSRHFAGLQKEIHAELQALGRKVSYQTVCAWFWPVRPAAAWFEAHGRSNPWGQFLALLRAVTLSRPDEAGEMLSLTIQYYQQMLGERRDYLAELDLAERELMEALEKYRKAKGNALSPHYTALSAESRVPDRLDSGRPAGTEGEARPRQMVPHAPPRTEREVA